MLQIIGGIAKVWVGEIVEEAKLAQVEEEHKYMQALGMLKNQKEDDINVSEEPEDKEKEKPKEGKENMAEKFSRIVGKSMKLDEDEDDDIVLKETLFKEVPLMPYHLKMARDEYERKRRESKMKIFD